MENGTRTVIIKINFKQVIMRDVVLNFKEFRVPTGISKERMQTGDARESLANLIYMNVNGIRAHALAMKIYQSEGDTMYSEEEVGLLKEVVCKLCTPNFIDGLMDQLNVNRDQVKTDGTDR